MTNEAYERVNRSSLKDADLYYGPYNGKIWYIEPRKTKNQADQPIGYGTVRQAILKGGTTNYNSPNFKNFSNR